MCPGLPLSSSPLQSRRREPPGAGDYVAQRPTGAAGTRPGADDERPCVEDEERPRIAADPACIALHRVDVGGRGVVAVQGGPLVPAAARIAACGSRMLPRP